MNRRRQYNRYSTLLPVSSSLLKGIYDKCIWDHEFGEWKGTTHSGVDEATKTREWVCKELERIDTLRYKVMADWKTITQEKYIAGPTKKRKRVDEMLVVRTTSDSSNRGYESDKENAVSPGFKQPKTVSFDNRTDISIECAVKTPRLSIEPLFEFPPPEIPDSQTTRSSFSGAFSTSPDADHEVRSQAPEPESPVKQHFPYETETTADFIKRYSFVLDIPTTDGQRVEWIKFLDKYQWNKSMISALREFFMADIPPNTTQTAAFLTKLKAVCATIEKVNSTHKGQKKYKLLWNAKVTINIAEAAIDAAKSPPPLEPPQPTWLTTPKFLPTSSVENHTPQEPFPSNLTASPTESQVREAVSAESVRSAMKKYVSTLSKGDRVEPPCDRCRGLNLDCRINKTSCKRCADSHNRCVWSEVELREVEGILRGMERGRSPTPAVRNANRRMMNMAAASVAGNGGGRRGDGIEKRGLGGVDSRRKRKRSFCDVPADGDETRVFLDGDGMEDSADDEEDEWVPSS